MENPLLSSEEKMSLVNSDDGVSLVQAHLKEESPTSKGKPTNIHVLIVTTLAFGVFVIAEIIGAIASNSLSLLGDGAAMSVDVFTYLSNMYAERVKSRNAGELDARTKMVLEVYIPSFSVLALLGVTVYILMDAIAIIRDGPGGDEVNVYFLFAFAGGNFLVDIVSSLMFYWRGKEVFLSSPISHERQSYERHQTEPVLVRTVNLNMISAVTHVGSDTMRTTSVFVAAVISFVANQNVSLCDAWAAVVVSITIVFAVIPLVIEIRKAAKRNGQELSNSSSTLMSTEA